MTRTEKAVTRVRAEARSYWEDQLRKLIQTHNNERARLVEQCQREVEKQKHLRRKVKNLRKEVQCVLRARDKALATVSYSNVRTLRNKYIRMQQEYLLLIHSMQSADEDTKRLVEQNEHLQAQIKILEAKNKELETDLADIRMY